jgi:uncharacterized BrkB/YihY/UPF0761 family membrane protein
MSALPAPASQPDEGTDPARRRKSADRVVTIVLLVGLFLLMGLLAFVPSMSLHSLVCINHPGQCDEALLAFANFMGTPALLIIFLASIAVSVVLLRRQRRAFYIPLIGAAAMIGCFAVWLVLVRNGFLIPYP